MAEDASQRGTSDSARSSLINLALIGYGKMGQTVAKLAPQRGFNVQLTLDIDDNKDGGGIASETFDGIDVAIEFTMPEAVVGNIRRAAAVGVNIVVGTTGWHDRLEEVREIVDKAGIGVVYAANFSIGVNLFYKVARHAAELFAAFPMYDAYLYEAHHKFKKDVPSGTAIELKRRVQPPFGEREIPVASVRAGHIPGAHELGFDSEADTVILRHTARNRLGFAEGALLAARWIIGKKGLFSFSEVLETTKDKV